MTDHPCDRGNLIFCGNQTENKEEKAPSQPPQNPHPFYRASAASQPPRAVRQRCRAALHEGTSAPELHVQVGTAAG